MFDVANWIAWSFSLSIVAVGFLWVMAHLNEMHDAGESWMLFALAAAVAAAVVLLAYWGYGIDGG